MTIQPTLDVAVLGCGEIGNPIYRLCRMAYDEVGAIDTKYSNTDDGRKCYILHVAVPGTLENFDEVVLEQIKQREPVLVVINCTVEPGTTERIKQQTRSEVAHVQVHGKHSGNAMVSDILRYPCFISCASANGRELARIHYRNLGVPDKNFRMYSKPIVGELMKLCATTLFGLLITWENVVDDIAKSFGVSYDDLSDYKDLNAPDFDVLNRHPGHIGGHCVMSNIEILKKAYPCKLWDFMVEKNES